VADGAKWFTVRLTRPFALVLVLAIAAGACSSGDSKSHTPPGVTGARANRLSLEVTAADVVRPDQPMAPLDDPVRSIVEKNVQRVFEATVVKPLTTGKAGRINGLFTDDAATHATTGDRAAMFDENMPRIERLVPDQLEVQLTALAGGEGSPNLVVAKLIWRVRNRSGSTRVERSGELSLIPVLGKWLVGAYEIAVNRVVDGATTTTTAASR
jgi:hypothetical protein